MNVCLPNYKTSIVRDIFVFCCFTGLCYADVKKLSREDIHTDERGDMWIIDRRTKTGTQFRVKLLPVVKQLESSTAACSCRTIRFFRSKTIIR